MEQTFHSLSKAITINEPCCSLSVQAGAGSTMYIPVCSHTFPPHWWGRAGARAQRTTATTLIDWFQPPGGVCKADGTPGGDASHRDIPRSMWYHVVPRTSKIFSSSLVTSSSLRAPRVRFTQQGGHKGMCFKCDTALAPSPLNPGAVTS